MQNDLQQYTLANLAQGTPQASDSATPSDPLQYAVTLAQSQKALQNALQQYKQGTAIVSSGSQGQFGPPPAGMSQAEWAGLCEAYAEQQVYGHRGVFPSATAAAQSFAQQGKLNPNIGKAPKGSLIYFSDPNQPNGHVGIADGKGNFTSATYNGVQNNSLKDWMQSTKQQPLGFVIP